ncbi:MAG: hypothetical protein K2P64_01410 [Lachnospiraceae bacterium]|nr:hypothetical protein [Lachnospiraceae bacterium]
MMVYIKFEQLIESAGKQAFSERKPFAIGVVGGGKDCPAGIDPFRAEFSEEKLQAEDRVIHEVCKPFTIGRPCDLRGGICIIVGVFCESFKIGAVIKSGTDFGF